MKQVKILLTVAIVASIGISTGAFIMSTDGEFVQVQQEIHSSYHEIPFSYMAKNTEYAIIGTVTKITPIVVETDKMNPTVFSDITVQVEQDLDGKYAGETFTVRNIGGETRELKTTHDAAADVKVGERILFFAVKEPSSMFGDNYYIAGLKQGKISLENGRASGYHIFDSSEVDLIKEIKTLRNK